MQIRQITKNEANDFYCQYEHLGNCGLGVWHYGCFDNDILLAVMSFGTTCFNPKRSIIGRIAYENNLHMVQLARGGTRFDAPKNTPSQAVAMALKEIRNRWGDTLVIAYSDTRWNEIGTIYQASNFIYLGETNPKGQANYIIDGEGMSGWTVRRKFGTRDVGLLIEAGHNVERILLTPKHRYVYIDAGNKKREKTLHDLKNLLKPYPSRAELNIGSMLLIREGIIQSRKQ